MSEARLQRALEVLLRGRTAFVVAHRLSAIRKANLVLVMEGGKIVERGTHESLLQEGGVYARLHQEFVAGRSRNWRLAPSDRRLGGRRRGVLVPEEEPG